MMARIAAVLVIVSQVILIWLALRPSGPSSIYFMFVGHPALLVGFVLASIALARRLQREQQERHE